MTQIRGIIEDSTGDLIHWARMGTSLVVGSGESERTDVPYPPLIWRAGKSGNHHQWNGSSYDLVANPPAHSPVIDRTVSGGTITIPTTGRNRFFVKIDTEGEAPSDNLDAILGGDVGTVVTLYIKTNSRTITVRDNQAVGSDKIESNGDFALNQIKDKMMLVRRNNNTWDELSRSPN